MHPDPAGNRTDDITGDLGAGGAVMADWGLHLVDVNLTIGNLVDLVSSQSKAFLAAAPKGRSNPKQ